MDYPDKTSTVAGMEIQHRLLGAADADALLRFTQALPPHDLLFVRRDVTNPKVITAWIEGARSGANQTVIATDGRGEVLGTVGLFSDPLSWSAHVGDLRVLTHPDVRGKGFGRWLVEEGIRLCRHSAFTRVKAHMTVDQKAAITLFEEYGFRGAALLRDHVMDRNGVLNDIVVLSCAVSELRGTADSYDSLDRTA